MTDADRKALDALVTRVRKVRAQHPDDDYLLGKAAVLGDPELPRRLGYADPEAMWKAALPEIPADVLVKAAEAAPQCTHAEFKAYGVGKMWLYLQLVHDGVIPRATKGLADQLLKVPVSLDSEETHVQTFGYATVEELQLTLDWTRQRRPTPPPAPPQPSKPPPAEPEPPHSSKPPPEPKPPPPEPKPPPPEPKPPPPEPKPPPPAPPKSPPPSAPPPAEPRTAPPPAPAPPEPRPGSRLLAYALVGVAAVVIGYRLLAERSERFEEDHRSLGQLPDEARPAPPPAPPSHESALPARPHPRAPVADHALPAALPAGVDAGPRVVEDEKNDMTPAQLEEELRNNPPEDDGDPLKKMKR